MKIFKPYLYNFLTWFSLIFAPIGAYLTYKTWKNTRNIKIIVDSKLDKKELSENLELYLQPITDFKERVINNNIPIPKKAKKEFTVYLNTLKTKFPHLDKNCIKLTEDISEISTKLINSEDLLEDKQSLELASKISDLIILLEKEVR